MWKNKHFPLVRNNFNKAKAQLIHICHYEKKRTVMVGTIKDPNIGATNPIEAYSTSKST